MKHRIQHIQPFQNLIQGLFSIKNNKVPQSNSNVAVIQL